MRAWLRPFRADDDLKARATSRLFWGWVVVVLLLAFWLGARSLDARPVWADERRSVLDSFGSFWGPGSLQEVWDEVAQFNPWHSPGYFLVLHEWGQVAGWEPAALRALSLFIALLAIAMTYRLGVDLFSPRVGLYAALILAASAFYVHYSFEMRVYAIMALLSIVTLWAYARIVNSRRAPAPGLWLLLFAGVVGLLYSHYLAAITLVGIGLYHLLFVPKTRRWWGVVGVVAAGGLTFVPWVRYMLDGIELAIDKDDLNARALSTPAALWSFLYMFGNGAVVLILALLALAAGALRGVGRRARNARLLWVVAAGGLIALLAVNQVLLIMHSGRLRYMMPIWPLFALVVGLGLAQLRRWPRLLAGVLALWLVVGLWGTLVSNFTIDLDGANFVYPIQHIARAIRPYAQAGDIVVNYTPDDTDTIKNNIMEFYFRPFPMPIDYVSANNELTPHERDDQNDELMEMFQQNQRVWIGYPSDETPSTLAGFETVLATVFMPCTWTTDEPDVEIKLYVRKGAACPAAKADE